jgi:hypothetical protein
MPASEAARGLDGLALALELLLGHPAREVVHEAHGPHGRHQRRAGEPLVARGAVERDLLDAVDRQPARGRDSAAVLGAAARVNDLVPGAEDLARLVGAVTDHRLLQRDEIGRQRGEAGLQRLPARGPVAAMRPYVQRDDAHEPGRTRGTRST